MEGRKDILFLCQYFYPEYNSSATLPLDTAEALVEAGFEVETICGYPKEYSNSKKVPREETYNGIKIRRLKYLQLKRTNAVYRLINYFSFALVVFLRIFKFKNYKAIIVYSNPPILPFIAVMANKIFKTKMVFVSYDIYPEIAINTQTINESSFMSKMMMVINKVVFKDVDKVVALSSEMKEYLLEHRPVLEREQVDIIPNWSQDEKSYNLLNCYENRIFKDIKSKKDFVVSYFGNMGIAQDLKTLVSAIKNFKEDENVKFMFVGHGNRMDDLREIVKVESLDNVKIFDFMHGQDFQDALSISDCFVVTLKQGLTGLAVPSKTYSYMMAGRPIIAIMGENSDIAKDLVENEAGYILEVGETDKLINSINELKNDRAKCDLMGKKSRKIFLEKYTKEICTEKYVDMMIDMLGERKYA